MVTLYVSSSCPVTAMKAVCEPSSSVCEPSSSPESATNVAYELFSCPDPAEEATYELSVLSVTAKDTVRKLHDCPVTSELAYDLSACLVVTRGKIDGLLVFPASVLETVYALSVSCVSVFPRLQSLLWVPDQPVPSWCSSVPSWCSSVPSWCSSVPSWCSPVPSWCSSVPSWCSPVLSWCSSGGLLLCLLRHGGLLLCLLRTGGLLPCLLRRGGLLSCSGGLLLRRGGLLSCSGGLLLCRGDPRARQHCYGGPLLHPFCRLHHGPLLCRSCLSPNVIHFYMDLARHPSPCSASAPPPSWIV